jgi:MFS family permease
MRFNLRITKNSNQLAFFIVPIALLLLVDNILSFIIPINIEETVQSNFLTGLILGASALVGFFSDILLPPFLKNLSWKIQFLITIILALFFPVLAALGSIYGLVWLFFLISILWGLYYEFMIFAEEDFVVEEEKQTNYSRDWGILSSVNVFTNIIGPIIASSLLLFPILNYTAILVGLLLIAVVYTVSIFGVKIHEKDVAVTSIKPSRIRLTKSIFKEFHMWKELSSDMYPLLILYFMICWVDMTFFVLGGVFGIEMQGENGMEWVILMLYNVPVMIVSIIVAKLAIRKKKKLYAIIALLVGSIVFALMGLFEGNNYLVYLTVFIASISIAFASPLAKAVLSDITKRADGNGRYVLGLYNGVGSIACFISPMIMGLIADNIGYYKMFSVMGLIGIVVSIILLIITPKKIRLNQIELKKIEDSV